jgi:hypothetical protein
MHKQTSLSGQNRRVDKATTVVRRCRKATGLNCEIAGLPAFTSDQKIYYELRKKYIPIQLYPLFCVKFCSLVVSVHKNTDSYSPLE